MNIIGPSAFNAGGDGAPYARTSDGTLPASWAKYGPAIKPNWWQRNGLIKPVIERIAPPQGVTYVMKGGFAHYGVNSWHQPITDRGTDLAMGPRPDATHIDVALQLAQHRIDTGRWTGPIVLTGTDRFKGAALERAIELNIPIGNPELQDLHAMLSKQRYPDRAPRHTVGFGSQHEGAEQQPDVTFYQPPQRQVDPIVEPRASDDARTLIQRVEEQLRAEYPEAKVAAGPLPDGHKPNEVQLYKVLAADRQQLVLDFADGTYGLVPRTSATAEIQAGDHVTVMTNMKREIAMVHTFGETFTPPVETAAPSAESILNSVDPAPTQKAAPSSPAAEVKPDQEAPAAQAQATDAQQPTVAAATTMPAAATPDVTKAAVTHNLADFTVELLRTQLLSDARVVLAEHGYGAEKFREVPFSYPTRNSTLTVVAANESGLVLHKGFGAVMILDPKKIPLPFDAQVGDKLPFRLQDGRMMVADPQAIKTTRKVNAG